MDNKLHDDVIAFQKFVNKHPKLIAEMRKSGYSWQYYYDKWVLNGENDPMWKSYSTQHSDETQEKETKIIQQLFNLTQKMDIDKVQKQIEQWDQTIHSVQKMLQQFLEKESEHEQQPPNQMHWFRD